MNKIVIFLVLAGLTTTTSGTPLTKKHYPVAAFHNLLQVAITPGNHSTCTPHSLPTRATGAQTIAGFGAVLQRIAPLLPPQQAAILEVMSMAVTVVAGCVDADEKQQEYLEFLKWKEQQRSIDLYIPSIYNEIEYAVTAAKVIHDNLLKPNLKKITAYFCSQFEGGNTTPASTIFFLNPATSLNTTGDQTSGSYKIVTIETFFSEVAELFKQGIEILAETTKKKLFMDVFSQVQL